jgi:hypothetical protein
MAAGTAIKLSLAKTSRWLQAGSIFISQQALRVFSLKGMVC